MYWKRGGGGGLRGVEGGVSRAPPPPMVPPTLRLNPNLRKEILPRTAEGEEGGVRGSQEGGSRGGVASSDGCQSFQYIPVLRECAGWYFQVNVHGPLLRGGSSLVDWGFGSPPVVLGVRWGQRGGGGCTKVGCIPERTAPPHQPCISAILKPDTCPLNGLGRQRNADQSSTLRWERCSWAQGGGGGGAFKAEGVCRWVLPGAPTWSPFEGRNPPLVDGGVGGSSRCVGGEGGRSTWGGGGDALTPVPLVSGTAAARPPCEAASY